MAAKRKRLTGTSGRGKRSAVHSKKRFNIEKVTRSAGRKQPENEPLRLPPAPVYADLSQREHSARDRALHVLSRMRREGLSLTKAAHLEHIKPSTVRRYTGRALIQATPGARIRAAKGDRYIREMLVPTALGDQPRKVRGSKKASLLGEYMAARGKVLAGKADASILKQFEGKKVAGVPLITDPELIRALADAGVLRIETLYVSVAGGAA